MHSPDVALLNFYRASELHGGLILGQLARRVRDPELLVNLTRHSAEEMGHALLWSETIVAVGGRPLPVKETYQTRYAEAIGSPTSVLEVLALTQVFERRVFRHFSEHLRRPGTHPFVQRTLQRMIDEERGHLSWVRKWLDGQAAALGDRVSKTMRAYAAADAKIYDALTLEYGWRAAA